MKSKKQNFILEAFRTGLYKCDEEGSLISLRSGAAVKLKSVINKTNGRPCYTISIRGKRLTAYGHQFSWLYFRGLVPVGRELNHIDGNKLNNSVTNLEIVTSKENTAHAIALGLMGSVGSTNNRAILKEKDVIEIRKRRQSGVSPEILAEEFGVKPETIKAACTRNWRHI
jgi:hypothetical protein